MEGREVQVGGAHCRLLSPLTTTQALVTLSTRTALLRTGCRPWAVLAVT